MTNFFSSLFSGFSGLFSFAGISVFRILITIGLAFVIGVFMLLVHRKTFGGVMYSRNFGVALVLLTMVTATVLMPAINDVKILIGLIGTLSFVRFRSAVKDPNDIVYMIWSAAVGIMLGAEFFLPALIGSVVVGFILLMYDSVRTRASGPNLLMLRFDESATAEINGLLHKLQGAKVKDKTTSSRGVEMTVELHLKESDIQIVDRFMDIPGVYDAAFLGDARESVD